MSKWDEVERFELERGGKDDVYNAYMRRRLDGDYVEFEAYDALLAHCKSLEAAQQNEPELGICESQYGNLPHRKYPSCINWLPTAVTEESK